MRLGNRGWGWSQRGGIQREVVDRNTWDIGRWYRGACIGDKGLTLGGVCYLVDPNQAVADLEHIIPKRPLKKYRLDVPGEREERRGVGMQQSGELNR